MCGIATVIGAGGDNAEPLLRTMLDRIRYRGFSKNELWAENGIALGANRLEIVDPEQGRQPATNEDRNVMVVLNGEIYNHHELAQELRNCSHHFQTSCDAEVIAHGYEEWGREICWRLRGMFAFVVYDRRSGKILVARDSAGIKPLYVGRGSRGQFFAASEAKALIGFVDSVKLLPPGHCSDGIAPPHPFGESLPVNQPASFDAAAKKLAEILDEAVAIRIPPRLPFAVFLSGGLDSSLLLALAARRRPDVLAISGGLPGSAEVARAREFCAILGVRHEIVEFSFGELVANYDRVIYHLESYEPNLVRASLITYHLCQRARQLGLRVTMAGEGADEHFAGYRDFEFKSLEQLAASLAVFVSDLHRTQLLRWDKMGMAHTVEVRVPFMDKKVVDFARNIPVDWKLRLSGKAAMETKAICRAAAKGIVPENVRTRQKTPMDEGVAPHGRREWEQLLGDYFGEAKIPPVLHSLVSDFHLTTREEMLNMSILTRFLPVGFIDKTRPTVRRS